MLKGFLKHRTLGEAEERSLGPELARNLQGGLPAIPLTGFNALLTAYANDCDAAYGFAQLVWSLGGPGDVLLTLSTSGNSSNVLHAVATAKAKEMPVIALTGSGGSLRERADIAICVPSSVTHQIQEYHLPIYHCLCIAVEDVLFEGE